MAGALAACGSSKPVSGTVVGHRPEPAHSETYFQPVIIGNAVSMIPVTLMEPDRYWLHVHQGNGEEKWVQVSLDEYQRVPDGQYWTERK